MTPYTVAIRFDLDREGDREALRWLSQSRREGYRTNSAAVIAAINEHCARRKRLKTDPYLETREKEDAFLQRVLDTVRQGIMESGAGNFGAFLQFLQQNQAVAANDAKRSAETEEDAESLDAALEFIDAL